MRALVVYESMFGNTRDVAGAIAEGLKTRLEVELVEVGAVGTAIPDDVALLVVGGPTHAHGMTTPETRADAAGRAGERLVSRGIGIREWLAGLPAGTARPPTAVFDTRIKGPGFLWGSAAKSAQKLLGEAGLATIVPAESFLVGGPTGPLFDRLADGELDRARRWGEELAGKVEARAGIGVG